MRIVYFGTAAFAVPALNALASSIVLVVSQPDRPSGRGMRLHSSPVKSAAESLGLEVCTPEKCRDPDFIERIRRLEADFLLVAAYGQILPTSLLESAKQGAINLHGSILPKYRGAAPIQRAIEHGELETGVTLMQMDRGMDTGDMIAIETVSIGPDETYGELSERLGIAAAQLAESWATRLAGGEYPRTPQDNAIATYAPKVEREESEIRFDQDAEVSFRKYRAFTPSPSAYLQTGLGRLKLRRMQMSPDVGPAGQVLNLKPLQVGFSSGSLVLDEIQPEGKPSMKGSDWANGHRLQVGMNLRPQ